MPCHEKALPVASRRAPHTDANRPPGQGELEGCRGRGWAGLPPRGLPRRVSLRGIDFLPVSPRSRAPAPPPSSAGDATPRGDGRLSAIPIGPHSTGPPTGRARAAWGEADLVGSIASKGRRSNFGEVRLRCRRQMRKRAPRSGTLTPMSRPQRSCISGGTHRQGPGERQGRATWARIGDADNAGISARSGVPRGPAGSGRTPPFAVALLADAGHAGNLRESDSGRVYGDLRAGLSRCGRVAGRCRSRPPLAATPRTRRRVTIRARAFPGRHSADQASGTVRHEDSTDCASPKGPLTVSAREGLLRCAPCGDSVCHGREKSGPVLLALQADRSWSVLASAFQQLVDGNRSDSED